MFLNDLLIEKYKTQKRLDEMANHDVRQYFENSHRTILEISKKYNLKIEYGELQGGFLASAYEERSDDVLESES